MTGQTETSVIAPPKCGQIVGMGKRADSVNCVRIVAVDTFDLGTIGLIQPADIVMASLIKCCLDVGRSRTVAIMTGIT